MVRNTAGLLMSSPCSIVVCSVLILSCSTLMASLTGVFISRCQARPSDVRLVLRLGMAETYSMYGVERSVVTFTGLNIPVGRVDERTMLEANGKVGVTGDGAEVVMAGSVVAFAAFSQAVCTIVSNRSEAAWGSPTLLVSTWNFDRRIVLVMLLMRSAVPI